MNLMGWSEHFVTGIDPVDRQHRALVDMINAAAPHLASGAEAARTAVGPLLDKLVDYAATHFKFEESLMHITGVTAQYFAHHQQSHKTFVGEVLQMRRQFDSGAMPVGGDLLRFLTSWLTFHILSEDQQMARQVQAIRAGVAPQTAQDNAAVPTGAPNAVYTAALIDLFSLLTERNRTLSQVNEEVVRAKKELEVANSMLETRVTERTRELALANSTLQAERVELVATLRRLEETQGQLLQAEKMAAIGQLAAGVAHEINNPIGFVTSNLGSLTNYLTQLFELVACYEKVGVALPAAQQKFVKEARARCEVDYLREDAPQLLAETRDGLARVKRIVDNLREYSHVGEAQWAPADLNQVLESALNVVRNELRYKAELVKELTPLPPLRCIVAQLSQVLVNLLVNAAQSIQDKGTITLRTRFSGGSISVEIGDTGCGMTEETRKRIFEPFFTTKPVGKGTGLGLSISWEIIKRHHGDIEVTSAPGKGTTFRITLPVEAT